MYAYAYLFFKVMFDNFYKQSIASKYVSKRQTSDNITKHHRLFEFYKCGKPRLETNPIKKCNAHLRMSSPFFLYKFILISLYINFYYALFLLSILYCIDIISKIKYSALKIHFLEQLYPDPPHFLIKLDSTVGYSATSPLPQRPQ